MKVFLRTSNKFLFNKFIKRGVFFKYNLKYKVLMRRFRYFLRNRKIFGIKRIFFGILIFLALFLKRDIYIYNVFLKKGFFIKNFFLPAVCRFKNSFSRRLNFLLINRKIFLCLFKLNFYVCKNYYFYVTNLVFRFYSFFFFSYLYIKGFSFGSFIGSFNRFIQYVKCNYSLLNSYSFDYINAVLTDNKSFLLLNPVLLNNIVAF